MKKLAYIGWDGRGNFGDDLIRHTWESLIPDNVKLISVPLYRRDIARGFRSILELRMFGRSAGVLIGGGTVLGVSNWSRHVKAAYSMTGLSTATAIGCGAIPVGDVLGEAAQAVDWPGWLELNVDVRGVRGPLSRQAVLRGTGAAPPIVGDVALALPALERHEGDEPAVLGLAFGNGTRAVFDARTVAAGIQVAMQRTGATALNLFELADEDREAILEISECVEVNKVVRYDGNIDNVVEELAECRVVVSERLHGCVASAISGAVPVALGYLGKCEDFMASVGMQSLVVQPDSGSDRLAEAVCEAWSVAADRAEWRRTVTELAGTVRAACEDYLMTISNR